MLGFHYVPLYSQKMQMTEPLNIIYDTVSILQASKSFIASKVFAPQENGDTFPLNGSP